MSGKNLGGAASNQSSGSADGGDGFELGKRKRRPRKKKHIQEQRFVIHPNDLSATRSELCTAQRSTSGCTTIPLHDGISEREIRGSLVERLPMLKGKRYQFLTKGETRNYFCPCSCKCEDAAHMENPFAEWNGKNVKRMARGNRVVYIFFLQGTSMTERLNGESETGVNPTQAQNDTPRASTSTITHLDSRISVKGELLPNLATKRTSLAEEEITSLVETITLRDQNQNIRRREEEQEKDEHDDDDDDVDDDDSDGDDDDDDDDDKEEEEQQQQQMQVDEETPAESTLMNVKLTGRTANGTSASENRTDSAYDTLHTGSTTTIFPGDRAHQSQLAFSSPLNTPTELAESWRNQGRVRTAILAKIDDITPTEGSVEGGYYFYITLDTSSDSFTGQFQVMFGDIPPVPAVRINDSLLKGKVPESSTTGEVQCGVLNMSGEFVSDTVPFLYTKPQKVKYDEELRRKRRNYLDGEITSSEDGLEYLSLVLEKIKDIDLNTKGGTSSNGKDKTRALSLLRMIVETAAKINAMKFFTIIFSTPVGRNVFKSFKDEDLLLEEVARENGNEELACFLEERHFMYRDDEDDSDDEVDWGALAEAAKEYQRREAGREIIRSTSSEGSHGYSGDVDECLTMLSEHDRVIESYFEEPLDELETTTDAQCQEEAQTLSEDARPNFPNGYFPEVEDCQSVVSENGQVVEIHIEDPLEEQETISDTHCQEEEQTLLSEESDSLSKTALPDLVYPLLGRDAECEQIIGNLVSNEWRVGVISGPLGIGKTYVAVEVGQKLLSKRWTVHYHTCGVQDPSSEIEMLLKSYCQVSEVDSDLISDDRNETCTVQGTHSTLLILDQLENILEADEPEIIPKTLQRFVDALDEVHCLQLLFVSRKAIDLKEDSAFSLKLEPLKSAAAVHLLQSVSQTSSNADLEVIVKGCGYNPLAIMMVRALIQKGISENDIVNMMFSSDNFWKKLSHSVVKRHFLKETETLINGQSMKLAQNESLKPLLSSLVGILSTDQKQIVLDSWIQEIKYNDEDEIPSYEKASDPRYCHCRLCMSSDGTNHLKLALGSSNFLLDLSLEDLKDMNQDSEPLHEDEGEHLHSEHKNERTACLTVLLNGLKFLLHGSSIKHHLKETLKKGKDRIPIACVSKPLHESNSYVKVDEESIAVTSVSENEPSTKMDLTEGVEETAKRGVPRTCMSNPLINSKSSIAEDIVAFPSVCEDLPSRGKKKTKLVDHWKAVLQRKWVYCLAIFCFLGVAFGAVLPIFWYQGQESGNDAAPEVNKSTVITLKVNRSRMTNGTISDVISKSGIISNFSKNCSANDFAFVKLANRKHYCVPCPSCHPGFGLSVPCGSVINPRETSIKCLRCEFGVTFSSSFDHYACQKCSKCAPYETVARHCMPDTDVICSRCELNQITWISSKKEGYECIDCVICSSGFEPSHPCGSTVPYGLLITCVQCQEGETFSTMTDREQCKRCSSCPPGQRLIARCTKYFDTICGRVSFARCGGNQIQIGLLHQTKVTCIDCLTCPAGMEPSVACRAVVESQDVQLFCTPCSRCCKDERDTYPRECAHLESRKCKYRICPANSKLSSTQKVTPTFISVSATISTNTSYRYIVFSMLSVAICFTVILGMIILATRYRFKQKKFYRRITETRISKRWRDVAGEFTLEELDARHMELYDWVCRKLDKGTRGSRRDYERLAIKYLRISPEERKALRNERKISGGSPTRRVMSLIQTLYPSLTLGEFICTLAEIGRDDIAQRLIPLILRNNGRTACSIEERYV